MKILYRYPISLSLTIFICGYFVWPLRTDGFKIEVDQSLLNGKKEYLETRLQADDSLQLPNIIILLADDLGYHDISLNGSELINTQHIDQLAKEGINFTNAYVSSPVCAPSRASIMTGRYQHRYGFIHQMQTRYLRNSLEYWGYRLFVDSYPWRIQQMDKRPSKEDMKNQGLPPSEISIAEVLKKRNYQTALIGKWHLGWHGERLPLKFGFDYHYGFYNSHSLYAPEGSAGVIDHKDNRDWTTSYIWKSQRDGSSAIVRNEEVIEEPTYLTDRIVEESIDFMQHNQENPFFLVVSFSSPHTPFQVLQEDYDAMAHITDETKRVYNGMIKNLDDGIGKINQSLEDLGLAENTLIIFLSDNGGATYTYSTDNGPLRGGKITGFNGGLKVPFIMKWKGQLPEDTTIHQNISALDILPTIADAANIPLVSDRKIDGTSLLPFLTGHTTTQPHEYLYWEVRNDKLVIKDEWKLLLNIGPDHDVLLYNLLEDYGEMNNVAGKYPNMVEELKAAHDQWSAGLKAPLWPGPIQYEYQDEGGTFIFDN